MATIPILNSSESVERFTPAKYMEAVRAVLGGTIDLDPASCAAANEIVKAGKFYTAADDGLTQPWVAHTAFLNPPYGKRLWRGKEAFNQSLWSRCFVEAYTAGMIGSGVLLVNACTSEKWFQPLMRFPICFPDHRIKFDFTMANPYAFKYRCLNPKCITTFRPTPRRDPELKCRSCGSYELARIKPSQPTKGQAFIFLPTGLGTAPQFTSARVNLFGDLFSEFGNIYLRPSRVARSFARPISKLQIRNSKFRISPDA